MGAVVNARYSHIFQPLRVGPFTLRNRITIPGHQPRLAEDSLVSDRYIEYQRARARGGAAMQCTGQTAVVEAARGEAGPVRLLNVDDRIVPGYQKLAAAVHAEGGRMLAQLGHMGATGEASNMVVLAPSWLVSEVSRDVAREMTEREIEDMIAAFGPGAARCRAGDLDGVEVLMYTGNLLMEFLSPFSNRRQDGWGGSLEHRMQFPLAIVRSVRENVGRDRIVGIKLTVDEYVDGGIALEEGVEIARRFAETGLIDYISVTTGNNLTLATQKRDRWPIGSQHAEFRPQCRAVKRAVGDLPVCYIGGVTDLLEAEEIVASGDSDLVGMVRAHMADPDIVRKTQEGRRDAIRPCIHSNVCINVTHGRSAIRCISNPEVGEEALWARVRGEGQSPHRAVVVGGGPGGLESARVLAELGHAVTLFEREAFLGGQLYRWSSARYLHEARKVIAWWTAALRRLQVDVRLEVQARAASIAELEPDLVVIATGSRPMRREIAGQGAVQQLDAWEALGSGATGKIAVLADQMGRQDGFHIVERLAEQFEQVHLVTRCIHVGEGEGVGTLPQTLMRMEKLGVRIVERARPIAIDGRAVVVAGLFGGDSRRIEGVDTLVYWAGGRSDDDLADEVSAAGMRVAKVGDALLPRRVYHAVQEGATVGREAFAAAAVRAGS
jgi:2,4-dienoyl-CoA reductase-like NADH-dependent reductase (Old Yellow Enzyme family)